MSTKEPRRETTHDPPPPAPWAPGGRGRRRPPCPGPAAQAPSVLVRVPANLPPTQPHTPRSILSPPDGDAGRARTRRHPPGPLTSPTPGRQGRYCSRPGHRNINTAAGSPHSPGSAAKRHAEARRSPPPFCPPPGAPRAASLSRGPRRPASAAPPRNRDAPGRHRARPPTSSRRAPPPRLGAARGRAGRPGARIAGAEPGGLGEVTWRWDSQRGGAHSRRGSQMARAPGGAGPAARSPRGGRLEAGPLEGRDSMVGRGSGRGSGRGLSP